MSTDHLLFNFRDFFGAVEGWSPRTAHAYFAAIIYYVSKMDCGGIENNDNEMMRACGSDCWQGIGEDWREVRRWVFDNDRAFKLGPDGKWHLEQNKFWRPKHGRPAGRRS